ncbi:MAG: alpha/beta hydrolase [Halopseudomonas aestusnigri]
MRILFVHGWGYGPKIWDKVIAQLGHDVECTVVDLGFFGTQTTPEETHYDVAVGHSLGVLWLLSHEKITWDKLVSICGFSKFSDDKSFPQGVSLRVIERMIRRLPISAESVLKSFHDLCDPLGQIPFENSDKRNHERLSWGLEFLRDQDMRTRFDPLSTLVLADKTDQVVPENMTKALFSSSNITWADGKGHLVPLTGPKACHDIIKRAILSQ